MKTSIDLARELGFTPRRLNQIRVALERQTGNRIGCRLGRTIYFSEEDERLILQSRQTKAVESPLNSLIGQTPILIPRRVAGKQEEIYQAWLIEQIGGETEVSIPAGYVDLVTDSEVIEIKSAGHWKEGVGQLLVYSVYFRFHLPRLCLFGEVDIAGKQLIEFHCGLLSINVSWLPPLIESDISENSGF